MSEFNDNNYSNKSNIINNFSLFDMNKNKYIDTKYKKSSKSTHSSYSQNQFQLSLPFYITSASHHSKVANDAFTRGTKLVCNLFSEGKIDYDTAKDVLSYFFEIYFDSKIGNEVDLFFLKHSNKTVVKALKSYMETENG